MANSTGHGRKHLAATINSRVSWPSAEPAAPEERKLPQTALQFVTEDSEPKAATAARPTINATPATPTAKASALDERQPADSALADPPAAASKLVQTERFEAPSQMPAIAPAPNQTSSQAPSQISVPASAPIQTPAVASAHDDRIPARGGSSTAQMLATLAGAITACIVAFVMFGFSARTIRAGRI
jgi:hypothetical protein